MWSPVLESFRVEFAHRLSSMSPDQLDELEETLQYMPEGELERLMDDLRLRDEALVGAPMLVGA